MFYIKRMSPLYKQPPFGPGWRVNESHWQYDDLAMLYNPGITGFADYVASGTGGVFLEDLGPYRLHLTWRQGTSGAMSGVEAIGGGQVGIRMTAATANGFGTDASTESDERLDEIFLTTDGGRPYPRTSMFWAGGIATVGNGVYARNYFGRANNNKTYSGHNCHEHATNGTFEMTSSRRHQSAVSTTADTGVAVHDDPVHLTMSCPSYVSAEIFFNGRYLPAGDAGNAGSYGWGEMRLGFNYAPDSTPGYPGNGHTYGEQRHYNVELSHDQINEIGANDPWGIYKHWSYPVYSFPAPASAGQDIAVGLATETDTALAVTPTAHAYDVGLASETDTGLAITPAAHAYDVGLATETDTALAVTVGAGQSIVVGLVVETDSALAVTHAKARTVGLALEFETALAIVSPSPQMTPGLEYTARAARMGYIARKNQMHYIATDS